MAVFKGTFVFSSVTYGIGWSEIWWTTADSFVAAGLVFLGYADARKDLLTAHFRIDAIRISKEGVNRDLLLRSLSDAEGLGTIVVATHPSAGPYDCLLCKKQVPAEDNFKPVGTLYMRGIPEDVFSGREYVAPGYFATLLAAMNTFLDGSSMEMRAKHTPFLLGTPWDYVGVTQLNPVRRTSHRVGRPFDGLRGRRRIA